MSEGSDVLEFKRFKINPESMGMMKDLKASFLEMQNQHPYLSGLGFFGSRTKGLEKKESDLDVILFYNSDRMHDFGGNVWNVKRELSRSLGNVAIDKSGGTIIDVSKRTTAGELRAFFLFAKPYVEEGVPIDIFLTPVEGLLQRFNLAVGDEVYANRRFILDKFKEMPRGEDYFQFFIKKLAEWERPNQMEREGKPMTPYYKRYPQTIHEAEQYFLTEKQEEEFIKKPKLKQLINRFVFLLGKKAKTNPS